MDLVQENKNNISELEDGIMNIDKSIESLKTEISLLEEQKKIFINSLRYEKATYFNVDYLPEIKNMGIYIPQKYHAIRYLDYPYDSIIIDYDNHRFHLWGRIDFRQPYIFEIDDILTKFGSKIPLYIHIYYCNPAQVFATKNDRAQMNDLATAILNAEDILGDHWIPEMAFGIALFYYWLRIHYFNEDKKYNTLYQMFNKLD